MHVVLQCHHLPTTSSEERKKARVIDGFAREFD
jgi:hypothetical protein